MVCHTSTANSQQLWPEAGWQKVCGYGNQHSQGEVRLDPERIKTQQELF